MRWNICNRRDEQSRTYELAADAGFERRGSDCFSVWEFERPAGPVLSGSQVKASEHEIFSHSWMFFKSTNDGFANVFGLAGSSAESGEPGLCGQIDWRKTSKGCLSHGIWVTEDSEFRRRDSGKEPLCKIGEAAEMRHDRS
jgi:hypothetical protein